MPIPKYVSFLGFGKETTPGTAVAASTFIPVTDMNPENVPNYAPDTAMRGSAVVEYDEVPTQQWGTYALGGPVFLDSFGILLASMFGDEAVTGASPPYTHAFAVLNSGTQQPASRTITDYNGVTGKQSPYAICSQLEVSYGADTLLNYSATFTTFPSVNVSKPTQSFSTKKVQAAYKTAVTIGGVTSARTLGATITLSRTVTPIVGLNGSTSPLAIWAGPLSVAGSMSNLYNDDTDIAALTAGTRQAIDLILTDAVTSDSLELHLNSNLFLTGPIQRGQDYVTVDLGLKPVANTTDAGASGGYSPAKATLINSTSTVY